MIISDNLRKELAGRNVLVVGGRGFIGRHISMALNDAGAVVTTLSLSSPDSNWALGEALAGDLRDPEALGKCLKGQEVPLCCQLRRVY